MRIVVDVTALSLPRTGIGNYLRGALHGIAAAAAGRHELVVFAPTGPRGVRAIPPALDGIAAERRIVLVPGARWLRPVWSRLGRPRVERLAGRLDVFHYGDLMYPAQAGGLRTTTIHDLVPLRFPEWVQPATRRLHLPKYRDAARTCDLVFVNSAFTGRDVVERLGVAEERVRVARPGVDASFRPEGERADLGRPYVLTAATLEPRKNLATLLAAHELLGGEPALAIAGAAGWGPLPELDRPGIVRLGYVPDDELARLYRGASAFAYPARFEGFGMPVVEAMASGTPVVASAHASLDEASGDAALRADPESPEELAAALERALADPAPLVERGLAHARAFTWDALGRTMLEAWEEAA